MIIPCSSHAIMYVDSFGQRSPLSLATGQWFEIFLYVNLKFEANSMKQQIKDYSTPRKPKKCAHYHYCTRTIECRVIRRGSKNGHQKVYA